MNEQNTQADEVSDRELLELAAKAAGIEIVSEEETGIGYHEELGLFAPARGNYWNPLTNDGDALRLVVRLTQLGLWKKPVTQLPLDGWADDPYSATRRAIVRAAAAIGAQS